MNFVDPSGLFTVPNCENINGEWVCFGPGNTWTTNTDDWAPNLDDLPRLLDGLMFLPMVGRAGPGDLTRLTPNPIAPPERDEPDPCAGLNSSDLDYETVNKYKRRSGGPVTAKDHISQRHLNVLSGASQ